MKHGSGQKSRPHGGKKNRNAANSNHNQPHHHHLCKSDHIRRENPLLSLCSSACCAISRYPLILIFFPSSTIFSATIVNYMDWVGLDLLSGTGVATALCQLFLALHKNRNMKKKSES